MLNTPRSSRVALVALLVATIPLAGLRAQTGQASIGTGSVTGFLLDPLGGGVPDITLARIATDGSIEDVEVIGSAHPVFANAAVGAVREWQFDETLLNCVPIEVPMRVTVSFRRQ